MAEAQKKRRDIREDLSAQHPLPQDRPADRGISVQERAHLNQENRAAEQPRTVNRLQERIRLTSQGSTASALLPQLLGISNTETNHEISAGWLTSDYLGPAIWGLLSSRPIHTFTDSPGYFARFEKEMGFRPAGVHLWQTDDVHISTEVGATADRYRVLTHEDLHYAAELGGGLDIRVFGADGRTESLGYIRWFHEGMTELHAQQLTREHGFVPFSIAYPCETAASLYIQRIVGAAAGDAERGREIVRDAYLSGDFRAVSQLVDGALGDGTFAEFIRKPTGAEAFQFIRGRLAERFLGFEGGPDFTSWRDDPLLANVLDASTVSEKLRALMGPARGGK